jgi:two-component system response regulator (stage 0 sporulation protein A)
MSVKNGVKVFFEDSKIIVVNDIADANLYIGSNGAVRQLIDPNIGMLFSGNIEADISKILINLSVRVSNMGYRYLIEAIKMLIENPDGIHYMTKIIYPGVAKCFDVTSSKVKRVMEHEIELAWNFGDANDVVRKAIFQCMASKQVPTNSDFLALILEFIIIYSPIEIK